MNVAELASQRVAIWGAGREAVSVVRSLRNANPEALITVLEESSGNATKANEARVVEGVPVEAFSVNALDNADVVVRSPGVSRYRSELVGRTVTTATNLWLAETHAPIIAITGTKGKSTTASLVHHILNALGRDARLAGNIGYSPLDELGKAEPEYWVLELSSFQSSDLEGRIDIAGLTSFSPEHLDWHGSVENYRSDKLNMLRHADVVVINGENESACTFASELPRVVVATKGLFADAKTTLYGAHNRELIDLAVSILREVGVDLKMNATSITRALESFQPLPHRLEPVGEFDGRLWINDSLSTTAASTIAAVRAFEGRPVTLLVGGHDRGISYEPLRAALGERPDVTVVTMPECGPRIATCVPESTRVIPSSGLSDAVRISDEITPLGGVVLLSPAAASFGAFRDYAERGQVFRDVVNALRTASTTR